MLTEDQLARKLRDSAEDFKRAAEGKNWGRAKALYNSALTVAVYMEIDPELKQELFGQYGGLEKDEPAPRAAFPRDLVSRVDLECCIKQHRGLEDKAIRLQGQSAKYYSDEDFCVRCKRRSRQ